MEIGDGDSTLNLLWYDVMSYGYTYHKLSQKSPSPSGKRRRGSKAIPTLLSISCSKCKQTEMLVLFYFPPRNISELRCLVLERQLLDSLSNQ